MIATPRGAIPELIDHGVTGFIVNSVDEAAEAVARVGEIDRRACRAAVEERFTAQRMADNYLDLYRKILSKGARNGPTLLGAAAS